MTAVAIVVAAVLIVVCSFMMYRQIQDRLGEIHTLVNSNLTKVQADLTIALDRIEVLEGHLSKKRPLSS